MGGGWGGKKKKRKKKKKIGNGVEKTKKKKNTRAEPEKLAKASSEGVKCKAKEVGRNIAGRET